MLLGFKKQFVDKILNGSKGFTLRDEPKRMPKVGETLYMYTGLRTNNCALICNNFILLQTNVRVRVRIDVSELPNDRIIYKLKITVNGKNIPKTRHLDFCTMDGFDSVEAFIYYWTNNLKFHQVKEKLYMFPWQEISHLFHTTRKRIVKT